MTKQEWLDQVKANEPVLREFVLRWHPAARNGFGNTLPITAPNPEMARRACVKQIQREDFKKPDVLTRWERALAEGDVRELYSLLDSAWFGVPESTGCWGAKGFAEAVDLLGEIPEE